MAQTPGVLPRLDEWLHYRLLTIQFKQWKRPKKVYCLLKALEAKDTAAAQVVSSYHCWWRNGGRVVKIVMTIARFDGLNVP